MLLLGLLLVGCGTDTTEADDPSAASETADEDVADGSGDETDQADEADVVAAAEDVLAACQDRDLDRLRDRMGDGGDQLRDQDRDRLWADDDAEFELLSTSVESDGDTATVTAVVEVTVDGETTEVERVWVFERDEDGEWVLTEVPDCLSRD